MAGQNVELVRSVCESWERGDFSSAEWAHPDVEWVIADGLSPGARRGLDGLAEGERDFLRGWDEYRLEVDEYRELDEERVLVLVRSRGRGKASGVEIGQIAARPGAALFHVRERLVTRLVTYYDRRNALAELGLRE